ncbi:MAG: glycosyltransferase family 2 protein [Candidatus Gastranaerophilales bacterium]|nr:glycosyltransferase family 2 protein [Candidatus Gastranaerophilales bacterium]
MPKFSLVVATLGRDTELKRLFESLKIQDYKDFEVVVVDQNKDDRVKKIVDEYKEIFDIKHHQVDFVGIGKARDYGIKHSGGQIIAIPDDDCTYNPDVLSIAAKKFDETENLAILSAGSYDIENPEKFGQSINFPFEKKITKLKPIGIEYTIFFNISIIKRKELYFDPEFGINAKYKGSEGPELMYRLLSQGYKGLYTPTIKIYHKVTIDHQNLQKRYNYAYGDGAFIKKNLLKGDLDVLYYVARNMLYGPIKNMIKGLLFDRNLFMTNLYLFMGIWAGFFAYKKNKNNINAQ